eukprot:5072858-Pyramimonas_sp.AAC.1
MRQPAVQMLSGIEAPDDHMTDMGKTCFHKGGESPCGGERCQRCWLLPSARHLRMCCRLICAVLSCRAIHFHIAAGSWMTCPGLPRNVLLQCLLQ